MACLYNKIKLDFVMLLLLWLFIVGVAKNCQGYHVTWRREIHISLTFYHFLWHFCSFLAKIFRYLTGAKPPSPQKPTPALNKKQYELNRNRIFTDKWCKQFSWLIFDEEKELMFCICCVEAKLSCRYFFC